MRNRGRQETGQRASARGGVHTWRIFQREEIINDHHRRTKIVSLALTPEEEGSPHVGENQPPHYGLCANPRCRKGPSGTRGVLKSPRAKYCCTYCRVDVCRRSRPKPEQSEKPTRKRRRDTKYSSRAERQRAHYARHRSEPLPQPIKDYLGIGARRAGEAGKRAPEPV
jgi:hypothetical protein